MRLRGLVYRAHNPQWSWTPLSGEGDRRHGGRFNGRGVAGHNASLAPLTAIREVHPPGRPMQPLAPCAHEVDAEPVFDAMDDERHSALDVTGADLACPPAKRKCWPGAYR